MKLYERAAYEKNWKLATKKDVADLPEAIKIACEQCEAKPSDFDPPEIHFRGGDQLYKLVP